MGTPFENLYTQFEIRARSFELLDLPEIMLKELMTMWLRLATDTFAPLCYQDIYDTDYGSDHFDVVLTPAEEDIIVSKMLFYYADRLIADIEKVGENHLNSRDYRVYSEDKKLYAKLAVRKQLTLEIAEKESQYGYRHMLKKGKR